MRNAYDLNLLASFVAVAEELHFGRAARRLHIAQPPLSVRIRRLEESLGARLFERSRRHVALTEAGAVLLVRARRLLADAEAAGAEARGVAAGEGGTLVVGYTPTATHEVLPWLLKRHRACHPRVRLELREMRSPLQAAAIREGRIEAGFVCAPVPADGCEAHVLREERLVLALPARHPLARRARVPARALDRLPLVLVDPNAEPGWALPALEALREARVAPEVVQETDGKIAQLGLVAGGIGVALVSESTACLRREGVVLRPITGLEVRLRLALLTSPSPSPRARAFRDLAWKFAARRARRA